MKTMKPMLVVMMTAAMMAPTLEARAAASCGTATLLDVELVTAVVPQPSIITARDRSKKPGIHDWFAYSTPNARLDKKYLVTVRLNDVVYTGESSGNAFWHYNPTSLAINDEVQVCVADGRLRLTRPDGKQYSTKLVRTARDPQSSSE